MTTLAATALHVRPLRATDRAAYLEAVGGLSELTRLRRFHAPKPTLTPREVDHLLDNGHDRAEALAAFDGQRIVGVARFAPERLEPEVADLAIVVMDAWQGQGVGDLLLGRLRPLIAAAGYATVRATTQADNAPVHGLLRKHGFYAAGREGATLTFEAPA